MRSAFYSPGRNWSRRARGFCLRLAAAAALFVLILGISGFGGEPGRFVRRAVDYALTRNYDLAGYGAQIARGLQGIREAAVPQGKQGLEVEVAAPQREESYSLPDLPVSGRLVRGFGWQEDGSGWPRFSEGIELAVQEGALVRAALPGKVSRVAEDRSLGKIVVIEHGGAGSTLYGRLGEVGVKEGQDVAQGQVIGAVSGNLFHFELKEGDSLVDPLSRLQQR
ncbi:MAG: hypothetical protein PWP44_1440 [Thermacetogenium sp.]|nr:hypothetical protein [Thermacetogenium sp.]